MCEGLKYPALFKVKGWKSASIVLIAGLQK
jgi:hypothetical protein